MKIATFPPIHIARLLRVMAETRKIREQRAKIDAALARQTTKPKY